jgi:hypothetical protein
MANEIDFLTSVNCAAGVLSPDTLRLHLDYLREQLRQRTRLLSSNGYGIIDSSDPKYNASSTTTKALWPVLASTGDYSQVTVYPGRAVTPVGDILELTSSTTVTIPGVYPGDVSLILAVYSDDDSGTRALTMDGQVVDVGTVVMTTITAVLRSTYEAYSDSDLQNMIVLGTVLWSDSTAPTLYTDYSQDYTWNRPWFSAYDVKHRNAVGTGTITDTNPHGLGLNDLAVGRLALYDQLTSSGMILSKDTSTPGIPGYLCVDEFATDSILTDSNGKATEDSWFSAPGRYYVKLSAIPNCVHGARLKSDTTVEYAIDWVKGTNIVLLVVNLKPASTIQIYYSRSEAGSISSSDSTSVTFTQCGSDELVVVNGTAKTNLLRLTATVRKYGSVPRELSFIAGTSGQIYVDPTVVLAFTELLLSANTVLAPDVSLPTAGKIGVGIVDLSTLSTTSAYFNVTGTNTSGETVDEIVSFDSSTWSTTDVPADYENSQQVHWTSQVFATLVSVTPLNTTTYPMTDVGSAKFIVFLKQDQALVKTAKLATAFWDGTAMTKLCDARRVLPVVKDGWYGYTSLHQASESIVGIDDILGTGNNSQLIVAEDFAQPLYLQSYTVEWDGTGKLDVPLINANLSSSSTIMRCYRSRAIPLKVSDSDLCRVVVMLFGGDPDVNVLGSVRAVYRKKDGTSAEAVFVPFTTDGTGSLFVGFVNVHWDSMAFVISGRCHGFAAYYVRPTVVDSTYVVVPV